MQGGLISRTWVGNADSDVSIVKTLAVELQSLLQSLDSSELGVAKTLGATFSAILNNTDAYNLAVGEEIVYVFLGRIIREVTEMSSVRGLRGQLGGVFALLTGVACTKRLVVPNKGSVAPKLSRLTCVSVAAAAEAGHTAGTAAALERGKGLGA